MLQMLRILRTLQALRTLLMPCRPSEPLLPLVPFLDALRPAIGASRLGRAPTGQLYPDPPLSETQVHPRHPHTSPHPSESLWTLLTLPRPRQAHTPTPRSPLEPTRPSPGLLHAAGPGGKVFLKNKRGPEVISSAWTRRPHFALRPWNRSSRRSPSCADI